jgi:hypothetical protein
MHVDTVQGIESRCERTPQPWIFQRRLDHGSTMMYPRQMSCPEVHCLLPLALTSVVDHFAVPRSNAYVSLHVQDKLSKLTCGVRISKLEVDSHFRLPTGSTCFCCTPLWIIALRFPCMAALEVRLRKVSYQPSDYHSSQVSVRIRGLRVALYI